MNFHFKDEEEFMIKHKFPEYEQHKKEHDKFREGINKIKFAYEKGTDKMEHELFGLLKDWWQNHIHNWDKKFIEFIKSS